jgi:hypothetical protein
MIVRSYGKLLNFQSPSASVNLNEVTGIEEIAVFVFLLG